MSLFEKHKNLLEQSIAALHHRSYYAAYPEHPKAYGEEAPALGQAKWQAALNQDFAELMQQQANGKVAEEVSPYTQEKLNISYPTFAVDDLIKNAQAASKKWAKLGVSERAGILIESWERMKSRFFELAHATQHTTGQSFMMSFQASGPHAADRAMESIALGYEELTQYPAQVEWRKPMGKFDLLLNKTFHAIPKGINLVIGCSTFPTWNTVPGMYAGLITGNTVIVKPHPGAVYPIAIVIAELQKVLQEQGLDPHIIQLACDEPKHLIAKELAEHKEVKLIDYTGGSSFGNYIESIAGKTSFTEKAGVNSVIIDSCKKIDDMVSNLAFAVSLYSGQMCTAPQNFFIPKTGIKTDEGVVIFDEFVEKFKTAVSGIANNPKMGAGTLGAIQNPITAQRAENAKNLGGKATLESHSIVNEEYPNARTCSPTILELKGNANNIYEQELFGPIVLIIECEDIQDAISKAQGMCAEHGAITCAAYTTDDAMKLQISEAMESVFCPVSFNFTGFIWVNQHAAFSDFHVTGGNPAGNASFTNTDFITKRFVWVGHREVI